MEGYEPRDGGASIKVSYNRDGQEENMYKKVKIENPEKLCGEIVKDVKGRCKLEMSEVDDLVGSIFVIRVVDEDKTEEKLFNFFAKVCDKVRMLRHTRDHVMYMRLYDEIKMEKMKL